MVNELLVTTELQLGDTVRNGLVSVCAFDVMVVKKITPTEVTFFRPYVQTADFSCAGKNGSQVICYIGIEEFSVSLNYSGKMWQLLERKILR
jgi:hypothetical protein